MEKFADCIPEFPRRSPGIFTLHKKLSSMKTKLDSYTELMRRLPSKAESWEGAAREAFDRALRRELKQTQRLDKGLDNGAKAILKYAYMAEATERNIDAARARMQALDRQVDAVPDSEQNDKFEELKPEAQATAKSAKETIDLLNKAGDVCAAEPLCIWRRLSPTTKAKTQANYTSLITMTSIESTTSSSTWIFARFRRAESAIAICWRPLWQ